MKFPLPHKVKEGVNKEFSFETRSGCVPSIQVNVAEEFTLEQKIKILKRLKSNINQKKLQAEDSNTPGDKYTECNWGLCTKDPDVYPDPNMHRWPYDFINHGRVAPLQWLGSICPMNTNPESGRGCFYSCRIFQGTKTTQQEALQLTQISLSKLQEQNNE